MSPSPCRTRSRCSSAARATGCSASSPATPTSGTCGAWPTPSPSAAPCSTQHCERIGRDPAEIKRSAQALFLVTDDEAKAKAFREDTARPAVAGTADDIAEAVAEWQAIGLDEVIVPDFTLGKGQNRLDRLDLIIEQVAPQFR